MLESKETSLFCHDSFIIFLLFYFFIGGEPYMAVTKSLSLYLLYLNCGCLEQDFD